MPIDHVALFAEDQARYVVTCLPHRPGISSRPPAKAGVPAEAIGTVTAGAALIVEGHVSISLDELRSAHEGWFPAYHG